MLCKLKTLLAIFLLSTRLSVLGETWTDIKGRTISADFVKLEEEVLTLKKGIKTFSFDISKLDSPSERKARDWAKGYIYRFLVSNKFVMEPSKYNYYYDEEVNNKPFGIRFKRDGTILKKGGEDGLDFWEIRDGKLILKHAREYNPNIYRTYEIRVKEGNGVTFSYLKLLGRLKLWKND